MHSIAISQGNTREAGAAPIRVVAPHGEGRAALYALTAALLLPPTSDDGEPLLAALRETDVSQSIADSPLTQAPMRSCSLRAQWTATRWPRTLHRSIAPVRTIFAAPGARISFVASPT